MTDRSSTPVHIGQKNGKTSPSKLNILPIQLTQILNQGKRKPCRDARQAIPKNRSIQEPDSRIQGHPQRHRRKPGMDPRRSQSEILKSSLGLHSILVIVKETDRYRRGPECEGIRYRPLTIIIWI
jgi:hypothetical protein